MTTILIIIIALTAITGISFFIYFYFYWVPKKRPFELKGCVLTANGIIINISFKINKTGYIAQNPQEIYLIDEMTGIKLYLLSLPKLGKMITRKGHRGNYGYMMIINRGYVINHRSKLTDNIGDYQMKHITII